MNLLYLTFLLPLTSFFLLAFSHGRYSETTVSTVGVGGVGLAALITVWVAINFLKININGVVFTQTLWYWISVNNFQIPITLKLDALSLTMLLIITIIGFFVSFYSLWYMRGKEGYSRFFTYTNLFISGMVVLILADNLLLMYLGWEIVGLCSYLLIGFHYNELQNCNAAIKAFVITRIGDILLIIALFMIFNQFKTLNFHDLIFLTSQKPIKNLTTITWATIMLLGGALSKSAQLPLQTWLVDAMAGPTPVSALIHSATMVTAGVYLILRTYNLFLFNLEVLNLVGIIGAITLVIASFAALVQTDIKKVLAYSTMSQVGYMFLALGVQGWEAATFHLINHAFFKALLFLSSGSVILSCYNEQNIFKISEFNLKKSIPLVYFCFLVGSIALSALPLVTASFYSKGEILWIALINNHNILMIAGLFGTFLTSIYIFRVIFIVFHSKTRKLQIKIQNYGIRHHLPLLVLMILSTFVGILIKPSLLGILPISKICYNNNRLVLEITLGVITITGIYLAATLWLSGTRNLTNKITDNMLGRFFYTLWLQGWGFDWLYKNIIVKPYLAIAKLLANDPLNMIIVFFAILIRYLRYQLIKSEIEKLRWYIISIQLGAIILITMLIFT